TAQFYWWVGHLVVLSFGLTYYMKRLLFSGGANWYYSQAYLGALTSYAIVIYKTYGPPQANLAFMQRLLVDENVEYLMLATYWYWNSPVFVTLVPFVVFSLFHVITYTRSVAIPLFFPEVTGEIQRARQAESTAGGSAAGGVLMSVPARASKYMGDWSSRYYSPALREVGVWEVAVIGVWLVVGALTLQSPFLAPVFYVQFLRMRYALSAPTRAAFRRVRIWLDKLLTPPQASPHVPGVVTDSYVKGRDYLVQLGNAMVNPAVPQQQQQRQ
ncbi:Transmembrane nucleoporin, partial [Coemansia aciculifera]